MIMKLTLAYSQAVSRGDYWFSLLSQGGQALKGLCASIKVADCVQDGKNVRYIAVIPDAQNPFPRARNGEVGLLEGWTLAKVVSEALAEDKDKKEKRAIVAVIDVPSQAYGRREEAYAIHEALAGAAGAYAKARLAGHPVIGLIVGKAMSGAFLAHGYQANRLIAFNDSGVLIHAMGKAAAARITLRSVDDLEKLANTVPPMAYDIKRYETLGLLWKLLDVNGGRDATEQELALVHKTVLEAIEDAKSSVMLDNRLGGANRIKSSEVRQMMRAQW